MAFRRDQTVHHDRGTGLARGPAYVVGAILAAFGLILFLQSGDNPVSFATEGFPDADVESSDKFIGFETNGWTAWITTAAGVLLLFGAAQHALAKAFSLAVGLALGACAVFGFVDGDVLGLAAANFPTELGWAIAAGVLILNVLSPRVGGDTHEEHRTVVDRDRDGVDNRDDEHREPVVDRDRDGVDDRDERRPPEEPRPTV
jgi:hypothetical protein